jgi:excisionase family DNA binding protein
VVPQICIGLGKIDWPSIDGRKERDATAVKMVVKPAFTGFFPPLPRVWSSAHDRAQGNQELRPSMSDEPLTRADVLTATEASNLLGIPRSTLYALARRNELPARQIGRRWVFRRTLLERATLPLSEADAWGATLGSSAAARVPGTARPLPGTVARSARNI